MKVTNLVGIVVACALAGCIAQAGTGDGSDPSASTEQGLDNATLTAEQQNQRPTLPSTAKLVRPEAVNTANGGPVQHLQGLQGLAGSDPSAPVQDDGDGKEPDPHPWHTSSPIVVAH